MALEEVVIPNDKIEVVGKHRQVQIREATEILKDGVVISQAFTNRYVLDPDSDISAETDAVKAICNAVWTDEVKAAWQTFQESQS
jgi:hypothetical protein